MSTSSESARTPPCEAPRAPTDRAFGVVVGSVALDTIQTPFGSAEGVLGGAAVYSSWAATILCPSVGVVGVVGDDFPQEHLDLLAAQGVDLRGVRRIAGTDSFRWSGRYEGDMSAAHTLETHLGVFADFDPQLPTPYALADIVFLANIQPSLQASVLKQATGRRFAMCDTMNFWIEGARDELLEVLAQVDLALLNDAEVRQLTGVRNLAAAAQEVLTLGPRYVVVKRGEHGASLTFRTGHFFVPAYPTTQVRDPTGAGDTFAGGILGYLCRQSDLSEATLRRAVVFGTALASITVEGLGLETLMKARYTDVCTRCSQLVDMVAAGFERVQ